VEKKEKALGEKMWEFSETSPRRNCGIVGLESQHQSAIRQALCLMGDGGQLYKEQEGGSINSDKNGGGKTGGILRREAVYKEWSTSAKKRGKGGGNIRS